MGGVGGLVWLNGLVDGGQVRRFTTCGPQDGRHEVDLIVARRDQRVVTLEVKLAGNVEPGDVRHLLWLREQLGEDLLDAAVSAFFCSVVVDWWGKGGYGGG